VTHLRQPQPPSTNGGDYQYWRDHTQIALQPVAAPSVLGLYGFAGATFIVAAQLAGWYGDSTTPQFLFPFAAVFGGIAQFLAGMWAYRARDALATAMHGMWGSFWIAYGILFLLVATGALTAPTPFVALGFWFIPLAAITFAGAVAASAENLGLVAVLGTLAAGRGPSWRRSGSPAPPPASTPRRAGCSWSPRCWPTTSPPRCCWRARSSG
jgi:succinate-acetate transporter protein